MTDKAGNTAHSNQPGSQPERRPTNPAGSGSSAGHPGRLPGADRFAREIGTHGTANSQEEARQWEGTYQLTQPSGSQVELRDFSVRSVDAPQITVERAAVGRARGDQVQLQESAAGLATGSTVSLERSAGLLVGGGRVQVAQSGAQWLVGGLVEAKNVFAITVIAGKVEGQVRCLFDAKGAFAFGIAVAVTGALMRLLFARR